VQLSKLEKKKSNDFIGNRTRDLSACSTVPQPITLTKTSTLLYKCGISPSCEQFSVPLHEPTYRAALCTNMIINKFVVEYIDAVLVGSGTA
jgi:hypothetical protein